LNMTVPFACVAARAPGVPHPAGPALDSIVIITDDSLQE
jgi:hypothetical protein